MAQQEKIVAALAKLKADAPTGYAVALHIRFTTPLFLFQTYPSAWIEAYSRNGFVMRDPTVLWGIENIGSVRWASLAGNDPAGIIPAAAKHGMLYGFTAALDRGDSRSIMSFTHGDQDFSDAEIESIVETATDLHDLTAQTETLGEDTRNRLRRMSITFTHP